jgi:hypothetical protein
MVVALTISAEAATLLRLESGQEHALTIPELTAAYSLRSTVVDVSTDGATVRITAHQPGATNVVVITPRAMELIEVLVTPSKGHTEPAVAVERDGAHLIRFGSRSSQFQNVLDWRERQGDRLVHLHVGSNLQRGRNRSLTLPSVFYRVQTTSRDLTLLDETIMASPLTAENAAVRGVHLRQGPWRFHAGYSTHASVYDEILPLGSQRMASASYQHGLSDAWSLTPSLFVYSDRSGREVMENASGSVLSLLAKSDPSRPSHGQAEVALSRTAAGNLSAAAAGEFHYLSDSTRAQAAFRFRPTDFASLQVNNAPGLFANAELHHQLAPRLAVDLWNSAVHSEWQKFGQTNIQSAALFRLRANSDWSFSSGGRYSHFDSDRPQAIPFRLINVPAEARFERPLFAVGLSHEYNYDVFSGEDGHGWRLETRTGPSRLRLSAYVDHQERVPTLDWIFSDLPEVRTIVQRLGIDIATPSELARILREHPELLGLGLIDRVEVSLAAKRFQTGMNLRWSSRSRRSPTVNLDVSSTRTWSGSGVTDLRSSSLSYAQELAAGIELEFAYSMIQTSRNKANRRNDALWQVSVRHRFDRLPFRLDFPGAITGVVFEDALEDGRYRQSGAGVRGVEVLLDGKTRMRTDENGRFEFRGVSRGTQGLEVTMQSERPFRFTTPSQINARTGESVAVGVAFLASRLTIDVRSRSGKGLVDVGVTLQGGGTTLNAATNSDGRLSLPIRREGLYRVSLAPETVPAGHDLQDLTAVEINLTPDHPQRVNFTLEEIRTISGKVRIADGTAQKRPLAGAVVRLEPLGRECVTDGSGNFAFRAVPAGAYELQASFGRASAARSINVPTQPVTLRVDIELPTAMKLAGGLP